MALALKGCVSSELLRLDFEEVSERLRETQKTRVMSELSRVFNRWRCTELLQSLQEAIPKSISELGNKGKSVRLKYEKGSEENGKVIGDWNY